jgi:long-chain fatty acid transport protein
MAFAILGASTLYATNGDTLIGVGVKARGMGGAGIAYGQGAESTLLNPALITDVPNSQISFGATIFMPTIDTNMDPSMPATSEADISLIPEVSLAHNLGSGYYIGTGMWGTAGMGVDFKEAPQLMKMNTQLQLMQFAVPVAYKTGGFSIAVAPIVQYGSLDIAYTLPPAMGGTKVGDGVSSDFGYGVSIGTSYDLGNGLKFGAVYKSKINMEYKGQLSNATQPFASMGIFPAALADNLDQPSEYGMGIAYTWDAHSIAIDIKQINWSDADGYKDFGWDDQTVFAIGYQYTEANWALRLGYNHASSPVTELDGTTQAGAAMNMFNLLGFPATAEDHYAIGGTYKISNSVSLDLAVVYANTSSKSFDVSGLFGPGAKISNDHSEISTSFQLSYTF